MNRTLYFIGFSFAAVLFCHCKSSRHLSQTPESIESTSVLHRLGKNGNYVTEPILEKAWYQTNIGITQIVVHQFVQGDNFPNGRVATLGYRFVDLKKKWVYEYATLIDTATVQRKYRFNETTKFFSGWQFANPEPIAVDSFQLLNDTVINSIVYRQCKLKFTSNGIRMEGLGLLRCDKKGTVFQIDKGISDRVDCPLVLFRKYPSQDATVAYDLKIRFIDGPLPDSMVKVFAAWRRNEKIYPVE